MQSSVGPDKYSQASTLCNDSSTVNSSKLKYLKLISLQKD